MGDFQQAEWKRLLYHFTLLQSAWDPLAPDLHWAENRMFPYSSPRGFSGPTPAHRIPQVLPGRQEVWRRPSRSSTRCKAYTQSFLQYSCKTCSHLQEEISIERKIQNISAPWSSSLLMAEHRPGTARGWQCGMRRISWKGWSSGTQIHANSFHVPGVLLRAQREGPWASASLCWGLCEGLEKWDYSLPLLILWSYQSKPFLAAKLSLSSLVLAFSVSHHAHRENKGTRCFVLTITPRNWDGLKEHKKKKTHATGWVVIKQLEDINATLKRQKQGQGVQL